MMLFSLLDMQYLCRFKTPTLVSCVEFVLQKLPLKYHNRQVSLYKIQLKLLECIACFLFSLMYVNETNTCFSCIRNISVFCVQHQLLWNELILGGGGVYKFHRIALKIRATSD